MLSELVYEALVTALAPIVAGAFIFHPRGRMRLGERLGFTRLTQTRVWAHGASAGEVKGLLAVLRHLPDSETAVISSTSPTGLESVGGALQTTLLPFDARLYLSRALRRTSPKLCLIGESELWPIFVKLLSRRQCRIVMVNARFSDRRIRRIKRSGMFQRLLERIDHFCVENEETRKRLQSLFVPESKISVTGNAKYAAEPATYSEEEKQAFCERTGLSRNDFIVTIGSIRPEEEKVLFPIIRQMSAIHPRLKFIVAPRHKEKFAYFQEALARAGISSNRHSAPLEHSSASVFLLDTFGVLELAYAVSTCVIIGGTFVDGIGGHNPLEAAGQGAAVIAGPLHEKIAELVDACEGITSVKSGEGVRQLLSDFLLSPMRIKQAREQAVRYYTRFRDSGMHAAEVIRSLDS